MMKQSVRWLVAILGAAATFLVCLLLMRQVSGPYFPQSETDRWAVSASFGAAVSAAVLASLVSWTVRHTPTASINYPTVEDSGNQPARKQEGVGSVALRSFLTGSFRAATLTAGIAANMTVFFGPVGVALNMPEGFTAIITLTLAVTSLYLAHVAGILLHRPTTEQKGPRLIARLCVAIWAILGISTISMRIIAFADGISLAPAIPVALMLTGLYAAIGMAAAFGPWLIDPATGVAQTKVRG